ncbi:hypothetical protein BDB01DRAFT_838044 [Pilobolus umbonatus]|nr:hypothetical protein BDB01DRAFT_838044 [Pilobolus umbonatus]
MTGTLSSDCHDDSDSDYGYTASDSYCWTEWIWDPIDIDLDTDLSFSTPAPAQKTKAKTKRGVLIDHLDGPLFNKLFLKSIMVSNNYIYAFPALNVSYIISLAVSNIVKIETLNSLGKYLLEEQVHILASLMGCSQVTIISTNKTLILQYQCDPSLFAVTLNRLHIHVNIL